MLLVPLETCGDALCLDREHTCEDWNYIAVITSGAQAPCAVYHTLMDLWGPFKSGNVGFLRNPHTAAVDTLHILPADHRGHD